MYGTSENQKTCCAMQKQQRMLGIKFLDHLILGSADYEDGRGYVSEMELSDK